MIIFSFAEFNLLTVTAASGPAITEPMLVAAASIQKISPFTSKYTRKPAIQTIASATVVLPTELLPLAR